MKLDAMGNPIIIGNKYGYSNSANGYTRVIVGKVLKETERYVTLSVDEHRRFLYGKLCAPVEREKDKVNVLSPNLFPLS